MSFWSIAQPVFLGFWSLLKVWAYILWVPFIHKETIWIIVPIWLSWFFAEFFQEKEGTSFGNAISNGVVPLWVGIDWARQLTSQISAGQAEFSALMFTKYLIATLIVIYGFTVIISGIKGKSFAKYFGRVREVTYVLAVLTPFVYGVIDVDYKYFISIILFFPLFYGIIELIDRITPQPKAIEIDKEESERGKDMPLEDFNAPLNGNMPSFDNMSPFRRTPPMGGMPPLR